MKDYIKKVSEKQDLTITEAEDAITKIFTEATDAQIGGLLISLKMKGETPDEIAGFATGMKKAANTIAPKVDGALVDVVGTGGDKRNTINISTASAIVTAATGVAVAKHGNRSITSLSGSADVLRELGIKVDKAPEEVTESIEKNGIGFMFAPIFHPAMKRVGPIRQEMGVRTVFNILGPLTNPANAKVQLVGVFDRSLCEPFAQVMKKLGVDRAMVVYGDGMDEISNFSETYVAELKDGNITTYTITPEELGINKATPEDIAGGTPKENAIDIIRILKGEKGPKRDIIVMNSAAALYVAGKAASIKEAIPLAEEVIDSGKALEKLIEFSDDDKIQGVIDEVSAQS
ncbi:anthranilate phosphoribosyltransferase [Methanolobus vulcani]|jgi:anthranilate phosphoribosyltransferase|uniref:Anthranilate phosphoribosyltransferase n=1 Tax=Methanolobus vulcani TaxID=38026 RepID=A0A7Z7AXL7_9EURY|nr:anthranilate phosphoribosyltransferase [Methanolobus vulcani]MDK2826589.1 anthranilate phosphoribosyltransferase [Methanolobus sp.]MDK2947853.1 anthranilate phosphoribosyltransferase [Methanolobus sp.]SDF48859.1 anthranilate phosphoribosyltransferase [Methanolobus vulcani]